MVKKQISSTVSFPIEVDERTAKILWRDSLFLLLGGVVLLLVGYVETNAPADAVSFPHVKRTKEFR